MSREFTLPDVGEGVAEGELVSWLVEEGETVEEDQPVAEVETDKAVVEVPSPVNGTVRELRVEEGDVVPVGAVIMVYNVEGTDDLEATADADPDEQTSEPDEQPSNSNAGDGAVTESGPAGPDAAETNADASTANVGATDDWVFTPPSNRRLARELGVELANVETSGHTGRITEADIRNHVAGGMTATATTGDVTREAAGTAEEAELTTTESAADETAVAPGGDTGPGEREITLATPATRRTAEEEGVDIDDVPTSEQREGQAFVTEEHVQEYAQDQREAQAADHDAMTAGRPIDTDGQRETREPYAGVRKSIGDAMATAKYTAPHVTHHDEVDVTELVETRTELTPLADEQDLKLTYMPFVMKACTAALQEHPIVNSSLDEENEEIVTKHYYNIGVATATDAGLMVPVIKNTGQKGLFALQTEMNELVESARKRTISVEEMRGGTFTITNVGGIGGEYATPIINYPESAILALGAIRKKPRVVTDDEGNESIEPRHVLPLSLSFDHRLIDGAVGARFTNEVKEYLENPKLLLAE